MSSSLVRELDDDCRDVIHDALLFMHPPLESLRHQLRHNTNRQHSTAGTEVAGLQRRRNKVTHCNWLCEVSREHILSFNFECAFNVSLLVQVCISMQAQ